MAICKKKNSRHYCILYTVCMHTCDPGAPVILLSPLLYQSQFVCGSCRGESDKAQQDERDKLGQEAKDH